jgi:hypothetical protein
MKILGLFLVMVLASGAQAFERKVVSCQRAKIGLTTLIGPIGETTRYFHDGRVAVYTVDLLDPMCCSAGIAIVLPEVNGPTGGEMKCVAILGSFGVDVKNARSSFNPVSGLLIEVDTREYQGTKDSIPGKPIKVRVNIENSKVSLE